MSDKKNNKMRSLVFAAILCTVCSLLLTFAASGLRERQQRNIQMDMEKNILASIGLIEDNMTYTHQDIESLYKKNIQPVWVDSAGRILYKKDKGANYLRLYLHTIKDDIESYVIPIDTRGLWGPIHGYLALEKDGSTVKGFTVYSHNETPGLGGEIESKWFRKEFVGKRIVDKENNFTSISIAKGKIPDKSKANYVDGISGATLTGKFLTKGLKTILKTYEPVSIKFRNNLLKTTDQG